MRPALFLPLAAAAACLALAAYAETRTYSESGFKGVSASAGVDVVLKQGPYSVSASGADKDLDRMKIEKQGETLVVSRKSSMGWFNHSGRVLVTVTTPSLNAVSASSGSDIDGSGLTLDTVSVDVSSGADVKLSGSCKTLSVSVSSGADFNGGGLKCESVSASASSGADAEVYATSAITGSASSGGDVKVHGKPASVTRDTSSGGDVDIL